MMDAAKWTAAANDATVENQTTKQSLNLSTLASDDNGNRKSRDSAELEALRQIYEQICAIRNNHADIVAENAAKRAAIQQRLDVQKKKLEELEAEHLKTGRSMKDVAVDSEEQTAIMLKYDCEQQELEHQRYVLEDLEFQMFELDAHYDEQKERIQQQLQVTEQQMISNVNKVYSERTDLTTTTQTPPSSLQTDGVNGDVDYTSKEFQNNNRLATEDGECYEDNNSYESESGQTNTTVSSCALATLPEEHLQVHTKGEPESLEQTPSSPSSSSDSSVCRSDVTDARRQNEPSPSSMFCSLPVPDLTLCVTDRCRQTPPVTPVSTHQGVDDCSSSTCSDRCITEIDETLTPFAGDEVKTQLLQQVEQDDDVERRVSISKHLQLEQQPVDDDDDDDVILRNNGAQSQSQSRPLTRYLPVRGEPLDLLSFVLQAGHFVVRCAADITVAADSAAGFLVKMGGRIRTWRRRWFVFDRNDRQLAYYVDRRTHRPKGCINFSKIEDVFVFDRLSSIKSPAPDQTFCVKTTSRTYYIVAPNSEVRQLWMEIIFTGAEGYREFF